MMPRISIQVESEISDSSEVPDSKNFRRWATAAIDPSAEVGVHIVGNAEGRRYNRQYRHQDYATNVLSFPFTTHAFEAQNYLGDVLMTAPVIVREAREQNKPVLSHWAHLFIHALLHLQGYRHDSDRVAREMEAQESKIMTTLGFSDPWSCNY